jgi:hypothetical protein
LVLVLVVVEVVVEVVVVEVEVEGDNVVDSGDVVDLGVVVLKDLTGSLRTSS